MVYGVLEDNRITVTVELNISKELDKVIYYSLCGRDHANDKTSTIALEKLLIAHYKLGECIESINKKIDSGDIFNES